MLSSAPEDDCRIVKQTTGGNECLNCPARFHQVLSQIVSHLEDTGRANEIDLVSRSTFDLKGKVSRSKNIVVRQNDLVDFVGLHPREIWHLIFASLTPHDLSDLTPDVVGEHFD